MVGMESFIELTLEDIREIVRVGIVGRSIYKSTEYNWSSQRLVIFIVMVKWPGKDGAGWDRLGGNNMTSWHQLLVWIALVEPGQVCRLAWQILFILTSKYKENNLQKLKLKFWIMLSLKIEEQDGKFK